MSRVEEVGRDEFMGPDGKKWVEVRKLVIREAPQYASSPEWNERAARRLSKRKAMWRFANMMGKNRKERRAWFRKIRREYGGSNSA